MFAITIDGRPYLGISSVKHQEAEAVATVNIEGAHTVFYLHKYCEDVIDTLKRYLMDHEPNSTITGFWVRK